MGKKKPKQTRIAGDEFGRKTPVHKDVEKMAGEYVEARNERMELSEREADTQAALVSAMEKAGVTKYICDDTGFEVTLTELKKAKVRKVKDTEDDNA